MKLTFACAVLLYFTSLASAQDIQIQALPLTVNYGKNDLVIVCSIINPSQLSSVFFIQLLRNSSGTFETVVSVTTGLPATIQWKDSALQRRATAIGNLDSPSSAQLRLTIDKDSVLCPADFKMYMCKMSGLTTGSDVVPKETSPITISYTASAQDIQIQALPLTVNYGENDLVIVCSIINPSQLSSVFFIQLLRNSSGTFETVVSVTTGQPATIQWKDSALQRRATAIGNLDSPSSAQLRLTIDKKSVLCPADFKMYMCKMSGLTTGSDVVPKETSPITISYTGTFKPNLIEIPRVRILNENVDTPDRQFSVGTEIQLTCRGEVGSDASMTIRWCAQKVGEFTFTGLAQTPIYSESSLSGCLYTRSSTITYNLTNQDTFTQFLCESGDTGLCGTGSAIQHVNITRKGSGATNP